MKDNILTNNQKNSVNIENSNNIDVVSTYLQKQSKISCKQNESSNNVHFDNTNFSYKISSFKYVFYLILKEQ